MPDLTNDLISEIKNHRIGDLDLGKGAVHPAYDGLSILNVPASLGRWLGVRDFAHPPLRIPGLNELAEGVRQVILIMIDAISFDRFRSWLDGAALELDPRSDQVLLAPLTSVVPSTTSAALTTLWTGRSPAEHGIVGYELFLREYGMVVNMITHSPVAFEGTTDLLYRAGFRPERALPVSSLGAQYQNAGIETHAFLANHIRFSGLSRMHYSDVNVHGFGTILDLWNGVRELADRSLENRRLIWVYYGGLDHLSHRFGPDSEQAKLDFSSFKQGMHEYCLKNLSLATRRQTLLLILADHGQIQTQADPHFDLRNHPSLVQCLHILPTGENRLAYFYPRPGELEMVNGYFELHWPGAFTLIPSERALTLGLFGPGVPASETHGRLGDRIAIALGDAYLWWGLRENPLLGRHGGLSAEEMIVPLMAARLR